MNIYARAQSNVLPWIRDTPLPTTSPEAYPRFQSWHHFHHSTQGWVPIRTSDNTSNSPGNLPEQPSSSDGPCHLVNLTWNIDAGSACARERARDIVTYLTQLDPKVDIIFIQEVSKSALSQILMDDRIRGSWFSSEGDEAAWGTQRFSMMTLLSKTRFAPSDDASNAVLGPIWRVRYPSRYGRDALCCDIFIPSLEESSATRIRLVNVHLDSLPIQPSCRPQQLSIVSPFLRSAGRGLVAGDFNQVLDEDATLLEKNGLVDAWTTLHPEEPGYTSRNGREATVSAK
ncbi:hypothetical protein N7474_010460 [Penicillium riverlandense]|uniref:uncharacterized protein n=1 Tax=Penicillium riverlandense TaxID=1903569 RepID=UPI002548A342|nr:uncharacterized protein N7474_010460 [Penicillium riverlandense]KAJ5806868.1 hypothetical protein N7474_010460 [Penicillium riverlandense]